ncbi:type II secretion system protein GspL [Luteimonas sp. MJ174]|uniref:type II secretion system protein GspL n=1 Tax=Luteimonas sp. MJ174 TaxID=3129237 RepID=UPI0031B9BC9D
MSKRILFLPADPAGAATLLDMDGDGRVLARTTLRPGATAAQAPGMTHTVLVVPGQAVRIDRLDLVAHSAAQAQAAARALLSTRLARPDALHVALDGGASTTQRTVAAVEPGLLRDWLARAAAFGLVADAAVPEQLLLPVPVPDDDATVRVLDAGDRWLVRGHGLAYVAAPSLAAQVLGERPRIPVEGGLEGLAARALQPEVDLLQGDFAPASTRARPANRRRLAWLAAALLASPLLLVAAQALRMELAARALESRATATAREALPAAAGADAGADSLAPRLQAAREPRAFAAASGALFAAVSARPGTHLLELEYQRGDRLRALVFHVSAKDIEALRSTLAADGWRMVEGTSSETPGGLRTGLVLEPEA